MTDYPINGFVGDTLRAVTVTIPSGASATEMFTPQGQALVGLLMPASWTAASLGYKVCLTGRDTDLVQVYDSGGNPEKTVVAAAHFIAIPVSDTIYTPWLQILSVSATDGTTPVTQGGDRTLTLLFRKFLS